MKAVTLDQSLLKDTKSGESNHSQPHLNWWGLYSPITPKTMNAFREKALWENNQRLLCQKDILKRQLAEVNETRKNIAELEAMRTAIKEVK